MGLTAQRASVLLVDDDPVLRSMAAQTLRHAGFDITAAASGEEGLRKFAEGAFDLVLLDVMMPGIDGFEVCTRLRADPRGTSLPVLMLTGLDDTDSIESAFRCGATDFVTKPINWALLCHRVRYSLRAAATAQTALRTSKRLASAQRLAGMGSWEWSPGADELTCSQELRRLFGATDTSTAPLTLQALLAPVCDADRATVHRARQAAVSDGTAYQIKYAIQRADGQRRTVFEQVGVEMSSIGQVAKVEGITQDITDRIEAERRIHQLAFFDSLTGLANRDLFNEMAAAAVERARRLNSLCAVLHLNLDRFKNVNDAFGHDGGDALLRTVAERLRTCIREADLASAKGAVAASERLARVGGNAFTVMLVDIANNADAALVATRLLHAVAQPLSFAGREVVLSASAGIALFPRDADDVQGLTHKAELALYAAKSAGRAQHRFFDEEMNRVASAKLVLENELRHAIGSGELRLFFQPKFNAISGTMTGAEALVRWQHPQRGLVAPGEFIALAEETGLILPLGDWVLHTACNALQRWTEARIAVVPLSINLSSPSFMQEGLVEQLDALLQRFGIEARQLTLEVTESLLMKDIDRTVARLHALRARGFGLSLDDFGTGFSSLSYLKQFPIDELKIDRSFVRDVTLGGRDAAIVGSIIALGKQFGLQVVAEGVETQAQSAFLLHQGCPNQQGFLFARPMPLEQFEAVLAERTVPAVSLVDGR